VETAFRKIVQRSGVGADNALLLGVSGGVDSVVLLDLLWRFGPTEGRCLQVAHLDHQIRPQSHQDADFVQDLCDKLGVPCRVERIDVPGLARERRLSLETAGREARRDLLLRFAAETGASRIVLAHHRDDQAETFLLRLLRGTGRTGLAGMAELQGIWWRPLLGFSREQILAYAGARKLSWVEDSTNAETAYRRNRIRHNLLPELAGYNPQISRRLASLSQQFQLEEDFWRQHLAEIWPEVLLNQEDGLRLRRQVLVGLHPAVKMRALREGVRRVRGDLHGIEFVHLEALSSLLQAKSPQLELDLPGCWAARRYDQLWLRPSKPETAAFNLVLQLDKPLRLPDGRFLLARLCEENVSESDIQVAFELSALEFPLQVRSPLAGDRFWPSGMVGRKKLKNFMIDMKLEQEQRQSVPLVLNRGEILWVVGYRRSALAPVADQPSQRLVLTLLQGADSATKAL
jgi:tRNA(Ile)-lysidine synthase